MVETKQRGEEQRCRSALSVWAGWAPELRQTSCRRGTRSPSTIAPGPKRSRLQRSAPRLPTSPAGACKGDVVFTMLADDHAVEGVVFGARGVLTSLAKGATHISSSTISVALSKRLGEAHGEAGQHYVAAPVFGRPDAAAARKLYVVAAGAPDALKSVAPLLEAIGQKTFSCRETAETANLVKLSGNFLIAAVIESLGEAMALVGKGGVDKHQYIEILTSTLFGAPVYKTYGGLHRRRQVRAGGFCRAARSEGHALDAGGGARTCACRCHSQACCGTASSRCSRTAARSSIGLRSASLPPRMPARSDALRLTPSVDEPLHAFRHAVLPRRQAQAECAFELGAVELRVHRARGRRRIVGALDRARPRLSVRRVRLIDGTPPRRSRATSSCRCRPHDRCPKAPSSDPSSSLRADSCRASSRIAATRCGA